MAVVYRPLIPGLLGVGLLFALTSCGGDAAEGSSATIAEVAATSYVVKPPVTTTTTTTTIAPGVVGAGQTNPLEQVYIIVAGDSVYAIASTFGITPEALVNYNGWTDGIQHFLVVGEQVKIPPGSLVPGTATDSADTGSTGSTDASTTQTTAPSGGGDVACEHTVVANDNPSRVADQYGVTLDELNNANVGNPAYGRFLLGDQIHIPAGGSC